MKLSGNVWARIIPLSLGLTIAGCGPGYHYEFTPPGTGDGRRCLNQCEILKEQCIENEQGQARACNDSADRAYWNCQRLHSPKDDSCSRSYCSSPNWARCDETYRRCYTNCGGVVTQIKDK